MLKIPTENRFAAAIEGGEISPAAIKLLNVLMFNTQRGNIVKKLTLAALARRADLSEPQVSRELHNLAVIRFLTIFNEDEGRQIMLSPAIAFSGTPTDEIQAREDFARRCDTYEAERLAKIKRAAAKKKAAAQAAAITATAKAKSQQ